MIRYVREEVNPMDESIEEQLKAKIVEKYKDMKAFSTASGIPYSTLSSMFQRGIMNCNVRNVIQLAKTLGISVDALARGRIEASSCLKGNTPIYSRIDTEFGVEVGNMLRKFSDRGVTEEERALVRSFLELPEPSRKAVAQFVRSCADKLNATIPASETNDLAKKVAVLEEKNAALEQQNRELVERMERQNREIMEKLEAIEKEDVINCLGGGIAGRDVG